jgi:hypothetical protein
VDCRDTFKLYGYLLQKGVLGLWEELRSLSLQGFWAAVANFFAVTGMVLPDFASMRKNPTMIALT